MILWKSGRWALLCCVLCGNGSITRQNTGISTHFSRTKTALDKMHDTAVALRRGGSETILRELSYGNLSACCRFVGVLLKLCYYHVFMPRGHYAGS